MLHKLKDRRGETLVETLASLLIAAIAMLMFAEILSAAASVTKTGRSWNEDINQFNAFLEERPTEPNRINELRENLKTLDAGKVFPEDGSLPTGNITITTEDEGDTLINAPVTFYVTRYGGVDVISYAS